MNMESIVTQYGYWAVLLGAMIEGESVILTASALCALGYLNIYKVGLVTFLGTLVADQTIYFLGYVYGPQSLSYVHRKFPKFSPYLHQGLAFLERNQTLYILSFRFIYGIRIVSPFIIGSQRVGFLRFSILNVIAAIIWTVLSCGVGFFLGKLLEPFSKHISIVITAVIFLMIFLGWFFHRRNKTKKVVTSTKKLLREDSHASLKDEHKDNTP